MIEYAVLDDDRLQQLALSGDREAEEALAEEVIAEEGAEEAFDGVDRLRQYRRGAPGAYDQPPEEPEIR